MRGGAWSTLQLVVAKDKEAARKSFALLLNAELDRVQVPGGRARISAVYKGLHKDRKKLVSREQVRKWLRGIDIPDQANLRMACERLNLDWTRLQTGAAKGAASGLFLELQAAWNALETDRTREELIKFARYLGTKDEHATALTEGSESESERASLQRHRRA